MQSNRHDSGIFMGFVKNKITTNNSNTPQTMGCVDGNALSFTLQ